MNNAIGFYKKEIDRYKYMSEICIKLLEFENDTENKKSKIRRLKDEIVNHSNYNRVNRINKEIDKAKEFHASGKKWDIALKEIGIDPYDEEYKKQITKLKNIGPKKYLKECINEIINYQQFIKEEKKYQREHSKIKNKTKSNIEKRQLQINNIPNRKSETLEEIIRKHINEHNTFIEKREIEDIKEEFGLTYFNSKTGYLSEETIEELFALRIVTELLDRHEEVGIVSIITAMDSLFDLSLVEMSYRRNSTSYGGKGALKYERLLNQIKETNRDFVEEYAILYEKVMKYLGKLSKEERQEFDSRIKSTKNIQDGGYLIMPEVFRLKVNEKAKEQVDSWGIYAISEVHNAVQEFSHYTKYMKAEEIASYYHELKDTKKGYDPDTLRNTFAWLIESRMKPIDTTLNKQEQRAIRERRLKAITDEYLDGEFLYIDRDDIEKDYATRRVESQEAIKQSEKLYFRRRKTTNAIQFINFKKLKKLSNKEILSDNEIRKVKGMF